MDQVVVDAIALNDLTNLNRSETEATAHACQRPEAQTCEAMGPDSHDNVEKNSVVISETMFSCATPPKTLAMEDSEFITAAFAEKPSTEDDFNNALPSPPDSLEPHSPTSPVVEKPTDKPTMIPLKRIPDEIVPSETLPRESSPPSKKYKLRSNTSVADTGEALSCTSTESNVSELIDETASPRSHLRQATHMDQNRVQSWHTKTVHDPAEIDPSATRTQSDNRQPPTAPSEAFLRRSSRNTSVSTNPVIQSSAQPISSTKTTSIETQAEKSRNDIDSKTSIQQTKKPAASKDQDKSADKQRESKPIIQTQILTVAELVASAEPRSRCQFCKANETAIWRRGPGGPHSLCNACGLRWTKFEKRNTLTSDTVMAFVQAQTLKPKSTTPSRPVTVRPAPVKMMTAEKTTVGSVKSGKEPATSLRRQKRFLEAGLYAPIHKQNAKEKPLSKREKKSHDISIFNFPLPLHHGDVILNSYHDFSLPADIMQEFNQGLIGKFGTHCTKIDKPHYTRIRSNIFVERKPNRKENKIVCQCIPPADGGLGCGEDCLNRMLFYECEPNTCPCGDQCSNRRFQKKEGCKNLDVFLTRERGWGLRTLVDIKRGDLIIEYRGEIISHKLCEERMRNAYKNQKNFYFLDYRQGEVVDACEKGTDARFINHSCDPNCHIEKWALKGELHVGVFASKDIPANTELFYDYNFSVFKDVETQQECRCGSENCRGILGKKPPSRRDTRNHISNLSK